MQKKISLGVFIASLLLAILVTGMGTFVIAREKFVTDYRTSDTEMGDMMAKLTELDAKFNLVYMGETEPEELEKYVMLGYLAGSGDDYAYYYTAEEYQEMINSSNGASEGVGISVIFDVDMGVFEVITVMPDSPALAAGMEEGDLIVSVGKGDEKESVAELGYEKALAKLRGAAGTVADFTVIRDEKEIEFSIERSYFSDITVYSHLYEPDPTVGVIRITSFTGVTVDQFTAAVEELTAAGATRLMIDLRNNPGGEKASVCSILDYLLPEGPILRIKQANGEITVTDTSDAEYNDIPLAVVVNENTASAAELFTAAVRDYDRGQIAGVTTFGKGCLQQFYPLSDGSVFKATTSMYYPPYSDNYHDVGIVPDVTEELDEAVSEKNLFKVTDGEDNQLAAAYGTFDK